MKETIIVPVCNLCNKPHFGRKKAEDRCWCDTSWNYTLKEILVEPEGITLDK
jgi:hypothetical protein